MSDKSARLKLPFIAASQGQKHITHNEALNQLDIYVQTSALERNISSPPGDPVVGDVYITSGNPSGEWQGFPNELACFDGFSWTFHKPMTGWVVWLRNEHKLVVWQGDNWTEVGGMTVNPPMMGINTNADSTNRLFAKSDSILFSHDDVTPGSGNVHMKINKAGEYRFASLLFQNNWSGRAEIGLLGDDHFSFKVSADGSSFHTGLTINNSDGTLKTWGALVDHADQPYIHNGNMVGQVAFFATNFAPSGWLECNGSAVSRSTYAKLFSAIGTQYGSGDGSSTFNLPDLRGEFLRGLDCGRGVDPGRTMGTVQGDAIRNITGNVIDFVDNLSSTKPDGPTGAFYPDNKTSQHASSSGSGDAVYPNKIAFDASRMVPTASENRPRNVALLACIKH